MEEGVVEIVIRYNGYWRHVPRTGRKKYECGNQRTIKVDVGYMTLKKFGELIAEFIPVSRGHILKIFYTIPDTNPRVFGGD